MAWEVYNDSGSDGGQDDSEYKPQACEVSQSDLSGESEAADLEDKEAGAPNKTKASRKGKKKLNRQNIQAARHSDATNTTGKLQTATSDAKCKAVNAYVSPSLTSNLW